MSRKSDWYDEELKEYDSYGEEDGEISYWKEEYIDHPYGIIPEQADSYVPPDKDILRAEKHRKKLLRQMKERETDARRYE